MLELVTFCDMEERGLSHVPDSPGLYFLTFSGYLYNVGVTDSLRDRMAWYLSHENHISLRFNKFTILHYFESITDRVLAERFSNWLKPRRRRTCTFRYLDALPNFLANHYKFKIAFAIECIPDDDEDIQGSIPIFDEIVEYCGIINRHAPSEDSSKLLRDWEYKRKLIHQLAKKEEVKNELVSK